MSNIFDFRTGRALADASAAYQQSYDLLDLEERRSPDRAVILEARLFRRNAEALMVIIGQMRAASADRRQPVIDMMTRQPVEGSFSGPRVPHGEIVERFAGRPKGTDVVLVEICMTLSQYEQVTADLEAMGAAPSDALKAHAFG
jgi:hypothetical protein